MARKLNYIERPTFLLLAAGVGCFLLAFLGMGLAPWTTLRNVRAPVGSEHNPYYEKDGAFSSIGRGRKIYIREGCWHCHSQFVRPVAGEPFRYGPTSQAWESMYDVPQTYGTRRIGPDLSRQAGRHSDDWHHAHLYNPRAVAPLSVMPAYSWLYTRSSEGLVPTQEGLDLVAYLQSLGKFYASEIHEIVYPKLFKVSGAPQPDQTNLDRGALLFSEQCSGCHGVTGDGSGLALEFLKPHAANLVKRYVSPSEAYSILNRGVFQSAMPSFREMPERDLWALALYVAKLGEHTRDQMLARKSTTNPRKAEELFSTRCAACHGEKGAGDGPGAVVLNPRPKDFSRRVFDRAYFIELVRSGVPGSQMAAFSDLSEEDLGALADYVLTLYQEGL